MDVSLENPKKFLPLMLFFGFLLVLVGTGWGSITSNASLANDGWIVVAVAILLWIFSRLIGSQE